MCKNIDKYKNMVRSFYAWLILFIQGFYYDKCKTIFCFAISAFYHFMDKNEKISLSYLFDNVYT